jgi:hypothetical protein
MFGIIGTRRAGKSTLAKAVVRICASASRKTPGWRGLMSHLWVAVIATLVLGGCQAAQQRSVNAAIKEQVDEAAQDCRQKRLNGELKTFVASVQCSNPRIIAAYQNANYPNMDLVELVTASRLAGAEKIDRGEITEAEFQLQLAELGTRVASEEERRRANHQAAAAQTLQAQAAMLQGLSAFQVTNPSPGITCTTFDNVTNCR